MRIANIHASCVVLGRAGEPFGAPADAGVLILGESGSGKSDLALRLIERGAQLVADDRVEIFARDGGLWAQPPANLAGLIEIRGLGIVSLQWRREARIALAIELAASEAVARYPERNAYVPPEDIRLPETAQPPLLGLAAFESSTPAKILAAAAAHARARFREACNPL